MTGNLYIDGRDVYPLYGIYITDNGYKDLVAFPPLKSVESNNWADENGEEFDLSFPVLDSRELSINFAFRGNNNLFDAFIKLLSGSAYHDFNFSELGKTYRLRLVSQANMNKTSTLETFSLRFADDFPLFEYSYVAPQSNIVQQIGYKLDGRNLSEYGVYILQGSETEIQKISDVKKNLLQNIKSQSGAIYDGETVVFQTKEVKLNCLMRAKSRTEFWRNYNALLYDLKRPNERIFYMNSTGNEYPCIYKKCTVSSFKPFGKIWFDFSLTLLFI
jgi:hypothetical protein